MIAQTDHWQLEAVDDQVQEQEESNIFYSASI